MKTLSVSTTITVFTLISSTLPTQAATLNGWKFNPTTKQLEVTLKEETTPKYFVLSEPPRIVIDLPNTTLGVVDKEKTYSGSVRQIRVSQFQQNVTRIVLELSPEVVLAEQKVQLLPKSSVAQSRWVFRPLIAGSQAPKAKAPATNGLPPAVFPQTPQSETRVSVPPLDSATVSTPKRPTTGVIEFGQPLPKTNLVPTVPTFQNNSPQIPPQVQMTEQSTPSVEPTVVVPPLSPLNN